MASFAKSCDLWRGWKSRWEEYWTWWTRGSCHKRRWAAIWAHILCRLSSHTTAGGVQHYRSIWPFSLLYSNKVFFLNILFRDCCCNGRPNNDLKKNLIKIIRILLVLKTKRFFWSGSAVRAQFITLTSHNSITPCRLPHSPANDDATNDNQW